MLALIDLWNSAPPVLTSALAFMCGTLIGYRIAVALDRRKEHNELVAKMRPVLLNHAGSPSAMISPINPPALDRFMSLVNPWQRWRLRRALAAYRETDNRERKQTESGGVHYADPAAVGAAIQAIADQVRWR